MFCGFNKGNNKFWRMYAADGWLTKDGYIACDEAQRCDSVLVSRYRGRVAGTHDGSGGRKATWTRWIQAASASRRTDAIEIALSVSAQ
jgi:hypothetical protein